MKPGGRETRGRRERGQIEINLRGFWKDRRIIQAPKSCKLANERQPHNFATIADISDFFCVWRLFCLSTSYRHCLARSGQTKKIGSFSFSAAFILKYQPAYMKVRNRAHVGENNFFTKRDISKKCNLKKSPSVNQCWNCLQKNFLLNSVSLFDLSRNANPGEFGSDKSCLSPVFVSHSHWANGRSCILRVEYIRKVGCTCNGEMDERDRVTLRVSRGALSASGIIGFYRSLWRSQDVAFLIVFASHLAARFQFGAPMHFADPRSRCTVSRGLLSLLRMAPPRFSVDFGSQNRGRRKYIALAPFHQTRSADLLARIK